MASSKRSARALEERIEGLRRNRESGAVDLALEALDLARDWLNEGRPAAELASELSGMHPAIATIGNVARLLDNASAGLSSRLAAAQKSLRDGNQHIAKNLQALIPRGSKIITLSNSSTVREALITLNPARVYVMHSLPGGEGERQAEALRGALQTRGSECAVDVVPDSTLANVVPLVNCALTGIDSYDSQGAILHKAGTLPLALCCHHFGKPMYAAGHSMKRVGPKLQGPAPDDAGPVDPWFDCTPGSLVTRIVTEQPLG